MGLYLCLYELVSMHVRALVVISCVSDCQLSIITDFLVTSMCGQAHLNCAYASDGGTMQRMCVPPGLTSQCTPGCQPAHKGSAFFRQGWCQQDNPQHGCCWRQTQIREMVLQHMDRLAAIPREQAKKVPVDIPHLYNEARSLLNTRLGPLAASTVLKHPPYH